MAQGSEEGKQAEGGMQGKRTQDVSIEAQVGSQRRSPQEMYILQYGWRLERGAGGVHEQTQVLQHVMKAKKYYKVVQT